MSLIVMVRYMRLPGAEQTDERIVFEARNNKPRTPRPQTLADARSLAQKTPQNVSRNPADVIVDEERTDVVDRPGREDVSTTVGIKDDHLRAALIGIRASCQQMNTLWRTPRHLVRLAVSPEHAT